MPRIEQASSMAWNRRDCRRAELRSLDIIRILFDPGPQSRAVESRAASRASRSSPGLWPNRGYYDVELLH